MGTSHQGHWAEARLSIEQVARMERSVIRVLQRCRAAPHSALLHAGYCYCCPRRTGRLHLRSIRWSKSSAST